MSKEKIYFEEGDVSVTASRVVLGNENFVLRNISAVKVFKDPGILGLKVVLGLIGLIGLYSLATSGIMIKKTPIFSDPYEKFNTFGVIMLALTAIIPFLKDIYYVQISTGGTPANTVKSNNPGLPTRVVEAINNALLDLDKNEVSERSNDKSDSGTSATDEVMKLKGLLDAGAITQDEFDAKKKELLGL